MFKYARKKDIGDAGGGDKAKKKADLLSARISNRNISIDVKSQKLERSRRKIIIKKKRDKNSNVISADLRWGVGGWVAEQ